MSATTIPVTIPEGMGAGSTIAVVHNGNQVTSCHVKKKIPCSFQNIF